MLPVRLFARKAGGPNNAYRRLCYVGQRSVKAEGLYRSVIPNDKEWLIGVRQVTTPKIVDRPKEKDRPA
jgi:hypothetical protein